MKPGETKIFFRVMMLWPFIGYHMLKLAILNGIIHTLWLFNIAMENGPFIDGLPGFTYKKW